MGTLAELVYLETLPFQPEWLEGFPVLTVHDWIAEETTRG